MRTNETTEINLDRRRLLTTAANGIAAAGAAGLFPAPKALASTSDAIRPFRIDVPEEAIVDLRRRIHAIRWPERETVMDDSQGIQLAAIREIARYWGTDDDWRSRNFSPKKFARASEHSAKRRDRH